MECQVTPVQPALDFGFRFLSGYVVRASLKQYGGSGHIWTAITRIQTELGGQPVYLLDRLNLPNVTDSNASGELGGGFVLGEGRYRVSFELIDNQARSCHAEWTIQAKLNGSARNVKVALKPGTIDAISLNSLRSRKARGDAPAGKLTVLLHAAPFSPRSMKIPPNDAMVLLAALSSLIDMAPARSVRLVVFSLDQRKEIYRRDHFTLDQLGRVRQALFNLQLATVDYRQLSQGGSAELLQHLVTDDLRSADPSAAVVFLGPHSRSSENSAVEIPAAQGSTPKFFYLEYQSPRRMTARGSSEDEFLGAGDFMARQTQEATSRTVADTYGDGRFVIPKPAQPSPLFRPSQFYATRDSIHNTILKLKGKRFIVSTPVEFARAMERIAKAKNE